ncbi:MAG: 4Fe-4S dicluster domain-containing protein [Planctomycetota bacterium]|jgi:formate hydrogenlyase subunit 6/NADH:ubiquinone oxidoreductase subunit I
MKILTEQKIEAFLKSIESDYDVRAPIKLQDGTRTLGKIGQGDLALAGGVIPQKITNVFFPQMETVLSITSDGSDGIETPSPVSKPLLVVGFTAQDADCLEFIDRFYNENYRDDIYFNKRDNAVIVCVSGRCGADGEFLKIAGSKCDLEFICDGQSYLLAAYTDAGIAIAENVQGADADDNLIQQLQKESDTLPTDDLELIQKASKLLLDEKVPEEFWQGISDRCIACTSCNLACPTCTCFDIFDRKVDDKVQRWRMWDSCQLDGFMREASGHNPMGTENLRTRRRIHHKLAADVTRWSQITCMLCGRCDDVCPTGIGIKAVCKEMVDKYGSA